MSLIDAFHGAATGPRKRRELLTPLGFLVFGLTLAAVIVSGLVADGLLLHPVSIVFRWTPLYILMHLIELKKAEEPELERRFGAAYQEYRCRVPMFVPRPWRRGSLQGGAEER